MQTVYNPMASSFHFDYSHEIKPIQIIQRQVADAIARDTEGKVRQALIDLGWTPPKEDASAYKDGKGHKSDALAYFRSDVKQS
jgi:hypothetical protein